MPLATTTVDVTRPTRVVGADTAVPGSADQLPPAVVGERVRAHLSDLRGRDAVTTAEQETVDAVLYCVPCGLRQLDTVEDRAPGGGSYRVVWARRRSGLGFDYEQAGLREIRGAAG